MSTRHFRGTQSGVSACGTASWEVLVFSTDRVSCAACERTTTFRQAVRVEQKTGKYDGTVKVR